MYLVFAFQNILGLHAQFPTSDPDPGIEAKAEPDPPPPSRGLFFKAELDF